MPDGSRTSSNRAGHRASCVRLPFDDRPQRGHAKPSGLGMVSMLNTRPRAPRKPPDRRSRALMWNMRRRHSSHSCKSPAARTAVKGAPFSSAFIEAKRRPLTAAAAEGTRRQPPWLRMQPQKPHSTRKTRRFCTIPFATAPVANATLSGVECRSKPDAKQRALRDAGLQVQAAEQTIIVAGVRAGIRG
jgi:hypothetical protein